MFGHNMHPHRGNEPENLDPRRRPRIRSNRDRHSATAFEGRHAPRVIGENLLLAVRAFLVRLGQSR